MSGWIDVDDEMTSQRVLVFTAGEFYVSAQYDKDDEEWYDDEGEMLYLVTHWMPLPEKPTK
ncbi:hypothetical protein D3C85_1109350 [compost metagenome]